MDILHLKFYIRCQSAQNCQEEKYPDYHNIDYWSGLRPMTPNGSPLLGKGKMNNLYYNTVWDKRLNKVFYKLSYNPKFVINNLKELIEII